MPAEAVEFVVRALLKESHRDKQEFHHQSLASLQEDLERIRGRFDALYIDKLDGKVTQGLL